MGELVCFYANRELENAGIGLAIALLHRRDSRRIGLSCIGYVYKNGYSNLSVWVDHRIPLWR